MPPKRTRPETVEESSSSNKHVKLEEEAARGQFQPRLSHSDNTTKNHQSDDASSASDSDSESEDTCPNQSLYLETIQRPLLDFDFETRCSVGLSTTNVYACLACGKYFQGRGSSSHAYFHSVDLNHHVFMNLNTLRVYVLPEGYEVVSNTLDDIKAVANPLYSKEQVLLLDKESTSNGDDEGSRKVCYDLNHKEYIQGFIGLNNIKHNDYANVVFQALAHVKPLRDFFLLNDFSKSLLIPTSAKEQKPGTKPAKSSNTTTVPFQELAKRTSLLFRKIWNPRAFKAHASPHDILQHISVLSSKRFTSDATSDPFDFLVWYVNHLHLALGGSRTVPNSSLIHQALQGKLVIETQKVKIKDVGNGRKEVAIEKDMSVTRSPFLFLSLDLPPTPLFKGDPYMSGGNDPKSNEIPQVMLTSLLTKYDGVKIHGLTGVQKRYKIEKLPKTLVLHIKRFEKNSLISKRNQTVVVFDPVRLDMRPYVQQGYKDEQGHTESPIYYRLVANIVRESGISGADQLEERNTSEGGVNGGVITNKGGPGSKIKASGGEEDKDSGEITEEEGVWKTQLLDKSTNKWIQIHDLTVTPVSRELLFLSESYIQIWERIE